MILVFALLCGAPDMLSAELMIAPDKPIRLRGSSLPSHSAKASTSPSSTGGGYVRSLSWTHKFTTKQCSGALEAVASNPMKLEAQRCAPPEALSRGKFAWLRSEPGCARPSKP